MYPTLLMQGRNCPAGQRFPRRKAQEIHKQAASRRLRSSRGRIRSTPTSLCLHFAPPPASRRSPPHASQAGQGSETCPPPARLQTGEAAAKHEDDWLERRAGWVCGGEPEGVLRRLFVGEWKVGCGGWDGSMVE